MKELRSEMPSFKIRSASYMKISMRDKYVPSMIGFCKILENCEAGCYFKCTCDFATVPLNSFLVVKKVHYNTFNCTLIVIVLYFHT